MKQNHFDIDAIGLDFDVPGVEDLTGHELEVFRTFFGAVCDQYPNNPLNNNQMEPEGLPEELGILWDNQMRCVGDVVSTVTEYQRVPSMEVISYITENFKARMVIYDALTIPLEALEKLDISEIRTFHGRIFINVDECDIETIKHLNDDANRRLDELKMLLE